jgi:benzoyl-CoA-dihydrodiol lyase
VIDFQVNPKNYQHWQLDFDGSVATLNMDVNPVGTLFEGYELKQNSYDLGVDIELYDITQRLRFEHPEIRAVVLTSAKDNIFCAGANIRMLGGANHSHKVNFCKFTNETRNAIEDASRHSGQYYLCAINGPAAGGGYELALATEYIIMADDGNTAVSLPEVPLLAVLPGTGGLTRIVDKRKVRRDHADIFCTLEEGMRGQRAAEWRLIDQVEPKSKFQEKVRERALNAAADSDRPIEAEGIELSPLARELSENSLAYKYVNVELDRSTRVATITISTPVDPLASGPSSDGLAPPQLNPELARSQGDDFWPLALCRQLDDAILHLRLNEPELGILVFKTIGGLDVVAAYDKLINENQSDWLFREIALYWRRTLKRVDLTSRTVLALIEPGSCFAGFMSELVFTADRSYMLEGQFENDDRLAPTIQLSAANFGAYAMSNGLSRLATRFLGEPTTVEKCEALVGQALDTLACEQLGLVSYIFDFIDWNDEIRLFVEERASFSPDSLTALEANLRFAGPETMETKIFGRLTAWQNWVFQRDNAVGEKGALKLYGSGVRPEYDMKRV